ncbi:MAG: hypothetical protein M3076_13395 [Actinomycetota bacterium]|nr:hypothetical protein [Actinomycetota bacterium]
MDKNVSSPYERAGISEGDLAALADGSLRDHGRRAELQRRIDASPELSATYERERRVVLALSEARGERAPAGLRMRIETARPSARKRARLRISYGLALAGGVAAVLLVLALALPGGPGGPSISQAAALALKGAAAPAPALDPAAPGARLEKSVRAVYFPNWAWNFGWKAIGQRTDTFYGRQAVTVYYRRGSQVVAYTIVDLPALRLPAARATWIRGANYRTLHLSGRLVVTWRRDGQTCVLSGAQVNPGVLRTLAAWDAPRLRAERTAWRA